MAANTQLNVTLTAKDDASAVIKNVDSATSSFKSTLLTLGGVVAAAFSVDKIIDFGKASLDAYNDAQVATAKFNTTMNTMVGTTVMVNQGLTDTTTTLKVHGAAVAATQLQIDQAKNSIVTENDKLSKLHDELAKGKITQADYATQVKTIDLNITALNEKIDAHGAALDATTSKTVKVKTAISLTADAVADAKEKITAASESVTQLGFDSEDTAVGMSRFYQVTGSVTDAISLNQTAMDLSRAKNIDYTTAANLVQMTLAGNGKALKAYGIDIKATASPLEALGELHDKVSGQAQAFADTNTGKIQILSMEYQKFQEVVGSLISEALVPFLDLIVKFGSQFENLSDVQKTLGNILNMIDQKTGIVTFFEGVWTNLVNEWQQLKPALIELQPFLEAFGEVLGFTIVAAIEGVTMGIEYALLLIAKIIEVGAPVVNWLINSLATAFQAVATIVQTVINLIQQMIDALSKVGSAVSGGLKAASNVVGGAVNGAISAVSSIIPHANGGSVTPGQTYLVGEQGPELFTSAAAGSIIPNGALGGGGITVNITGTFMSESAAVQMSNMVVDALKRRTRVSI